MTTNIPYSAKRDDLYSPCKRAVFFPDGKPESEAALCAEIARLVYCKFEENDDAKDEVKRILTALPQIEWVGYRYAHERYRPLRTDSWYSITLDGD